MFSNIFLIPLIFLFLTPRNNYADNLKMLKIFGKVNDFDLNTAEIDENCIQTCFSNSDCILAFFNEISKCLLFFYNSTEFLEVVETTRDDGYFVAFKTNLTDPDPNYCPSGVKFPPRIIIDDHLIFWNKYSGGIWHYRKCKPFQRSNPKVTVCIQVFITRVGITQQEAKDYCSWIGWKLIGVANPDEAKWIFDKSMELVPDQKFYEGIWIDGERKTPGYDEFQESDFQTNLSTSNPDFCPIESEISPKIFLGEDPISWTNTSDSTWQFKKCIGNWKMFKRSDPEITVCMQVFVLGNGTTQKEAENYCRSIGYQVTGVASVNETLWMLSKVWKWIPNLPYYQGIWIDGERKTPGMNNFTWTDGYTVGYRAFEVNNSMMSFHNEIKPSELENCLVVSRTYQPAVINDVACGKGSGADLGVACGYKLE
ncbi:hypothetical protein B9Z55_027122 [Caenorhabditis nigoni]|uniref:PAN-3 domain-containing protein n=1 Tax=Caenorhabditis nigoni TaxID=1611254 RepID=A0A2G5SJG6_9PELO|nr:hypothetical protein B9Z55_027122 [Caenorhabditis nigoni]